MAAPVINNIPPQFFTDAGAVAASHNLHTFAAGTTSDQATYSDQALTSLNANPIVLDSAGRATIFLNPALGSYKFELKDPTDTTTLWTRDDVSPLLGFQANFDVTGTAGEAISAGEAVYLSDGSGGTDAGEWYLTDSAAASSSSEAYIVGFALADVADAASGQFRIQGRATGLSGLTAGSTYYVTATPGAIGTTAPANSRVMGIADSTTTLTLAPIEGAAATAGPLPALDATALLGGVMLQVGSVTADASSGAGATNEIINTITHTLPSTGTIADGDFYRGVYWGEFANNANAKRVGVRFKMSDTGTLLTVLGSLGGVAPLLRWRLDFVVMRSNGGLAMRCAGVSTVTQVNSTALDLANSNADQDLGPISWVATLVSNISIVATGVAADDVVLKGGALYYCQQG